MKSIISYLLLVLMISGCASNKLISKKEIKRKNYKEVIGVIDDSIPKPDKYAMYPNGLKGIYKHIEKTINYPSNAIKNNIQGKVVVEFIVEKNGQVKEAKIIKSVSDELDKEALRVILTLNKWYPGFKDGKPVRILYRQPINFKLN